MPPRTSPLSTPPPPVTVALPAALPPADGDRTAVLRTIALKIARAWAIAIGSLEVAAEVANNAVQAVEWDRSTTIEAAARICLEHRRATFGLRLSDSEITLCSLSAAVYWSERSELRRLPKLGKSASAEDVETVLHAWALQRRGRKVACGYLSDDAGGGWGCAAYETDDAGHLVTVACVGKQATPAAAQAELAMQLAELARAA